MYTEENRLLHLLQTKSSLVSPFCYAKHIVSIDYLQSGYTINKNIMPNCLDSYESLSSTNAQKNKERGHAPLGQYSSTQYLGFNGYYA